MPKIYLIFFIFTVLAILVTFANTYLRIKIAKFPYLKNEHFLSEAEKKLYFVLTEILGNDYLIFSKVRMADLLYLPKMSNSDFYHYRNKIQSKHVDFLICDKENIKPLLVIELDDSSHLRLDRVTRDMLVDKIFESAELPILHIKVRDNYDRLLLLNDVKKCLSN